jgi:hypothetical protein
MRHERLLVDSVVSPTGETTLSLADSLLQEVEVVAPYRVGRVILVRERSLGCRRW